MDSTEPLRYLPIESGNQVFGIRMSDVAAVHRLTAPVQPKQSAADSENDSDGNLPVIDLRHLLWDEKTEGENKPVLIITAENRTAALLVDSVMPIRTVEDASRHEFPRLAHFESCFFDTVVNAQEGLVLIFDTSRLIQQIGKASPELVAEEANAG